MCVYTYIFLNGSFSIHFFIHMPSYLTRYKCRSPSEAHKILCNLALPLLFWSLTLAYSAAALQASLMSLEAFISAVLSASNIFSQTSSWCTPSLPSNLYPCSTFSLAPFLLPLTGYMFLHINFWYYFKYYISYILYMCIPLYENTNSMRGGDYLRYCTIPSS